MDINGKPNHIEDYLITVRTGQWFGWSDSKNKIYANLVIYDGGAKPTEQECTDGLTALQTAYDNSITKQTNDANSGKAKLKALGLTDDEVEALL
jgi:hypothetical protein